MPDTVTLRDSDGRAYGVPQEQVAAYVAQGFRPETDEESIGRNTEATFGEAHGGLGGAIAGGVAGGLSGLTLGLSDQALGALGAGRTLKHIEEAHPYATGAGTLAGALAPAFLTGGASAAADAGLGAKILAASPAGLAGKVGHAVSELGEGAGLAGRVVAGTAGAAAEGSLYGGGQYLTETALEDKPLSAEGFVAGMGHGALFGAPIGAAGTLASATLQRARSLFPRSEVSAAAAAGVKEQATSSIAQAMRDGDTMAQAAERKLSDVDAQTQMAQAGETVTRRVFGEAHPQALADQVTGAVDKQAITDALDGYQQARAQLDDWVASEGDPDLERALTGMRASDLQTPAMPVPVGEFGAPGARGIKSPEELAQAMVDAAKPDAAAAAESPATARMPEGTQVEPRADTNVGMPGSTTPKPLAPEEFDALASKWQASLSPDAKQALETYSRNGTFGLINGPLRTTGNLADVESYLHGTVREMDKAVASAPAPRDLVVYRGVSGTRSTKQWGAVQPGDAIVDPGFGSTSASQTVGGGFAQGLGVRPGVELRVSVPKGYPAAPVPSAIFGSESELLLPRNTKYTVTGVEDAPGGGKIVHVTASRAAEGEASKVAALANKPAAIEDMNLRQLDEHMDRLEKRKNELDRPATRGSDEFKRVRADIEATYERHRAIKRGEVPEPKGIAKASPSGWRPDSGTPEPEMAAPYGGKYSAAGGVVFNGEGKIAITRPRGGGAREEWALPKGRIDPGETPSQAALREVLEESGAHGEIRQHIGDYEGEHSNARFYAMRHSGDDLGAMARNGETAEVRFVTPDEAERMLTRPQERKVVADARRMLGEKGGDFWSGAHVRGGTSADSDLLAALQGTKSAIDSGADFKALGEPGRAEYRTAKAARTKAAAEHFRAKATETKGETFTVKQKHIGEVPLRLEVTPGEGGGKTTVRVTRKVGGEDQPVATAEFSHRSGGLYPEHVVVDQPFQRLGIGTRMYDAVETRTGQKILQSTDQTVEGAAFRAARDARGAAAEPEPDLERLLRGTEEQLGAGKSLREVGGAPAVNEAVGARSAAAHTPKTWKEFQAAHMGEYMKSEGGHAGAMKRLGAEWKAIREGGSSPIASSTVGARTPVGTPPEGIAVSGGPKELQALIDGLSKPSGAPASAAEYSARREAMGLPAATAKAPGTVVDKGMRARMGAVADESAIAKAIMRHNGKNVDIAPNLAKAAKAIGDMEAASAKLTDVLGSEAPVTAVENAKAYRAALQQSHDATATSAAKAGADLKSRVQPALDATVVDDDVTKALRQHDMRTAAASPAAQPAAQAAATKGAGGRLADVGSALEVLHAIGAHVPAVSHIPVIGPILGLWLKARAVMGILGRKGGSIGKSTESVIAAKAAATRDRIVTATGKILEGAAKATSKASHLAGPAVLLAGQLFPGGEKAASDRPRDLYDARVNEIVRAQSPGAIDQAIAQRYPTSDPELHDAIVAQVQKGISFLDGKRPKQTVLPGVLPGDGTWKPSMAAIEEFGKYVHAVNDPISVLEDLAKGHPSAEGAETLRVVYPQLYQYAQKELLKAAPEMQATLPYSRRAMISILYQIPVDGTMQPTHVQFLQIPAPAPPSPGPAPSTGPLRLGQQTMSPLDLRAAGV